MLKINGLDANFIHHFNDGTQQIRFPKDFNRHNLGPDLAFTWLYDRDEELLTLYYLVKYYRTTDYLFDNPTYTLRVPYLPNARMDRVQEFFSSTDKSNPREVFTLKFFCDFINSMKFDKVITFDVHSPVSTSLLNNSEDWIPDTQIRHVLSDIKNSGDENEIVVVVPDMGAYKRYSGLNSVKGLEAISGIKIRDWHTRAINSLTLAPITAGIDISKKNYLKGKSVLIIDDILSTGGTIARVIDKLLENSGVENIYIYCSHLENTSVSQDDSKIYDKLHDGTIKKIYTTNSIFRKKQDNVSVYEF